MLMKATGSRRLVRPDADAQSRGSNSELGGVVYLGRQNALIGDVGTVGRAKVAEVNRVILYFYGTVQTRNHGVVNFKIGTAAQPADRYQRHGHSAFQALGRAGNHRDGD